MSLDFANPAMLFGALLFCVPLLIHLLNRRRFKVKSWAAMSFLVQAHKRRRRRLRLESFLLLLVRCLAVILLAAAMARPFVPSSALLAGLTPARRNVVAVLDRSYSMGYRLGPGETCFDAALAGIKALAGDLDAGRGDTFSLVLMGRESSFYIPPNTLPKEALARLEDPRAAALLKEPSQEEADLASLGALLAGDATAAAQGPVEVYIFTDMQERLFRTLEENSGAAATRAGEPGGAAALFGKAAAQGAVIRFVDVPGGGGGRGTRPNAAVSDLIALSPNITTRGAGTFSATISNFGETDLKALRGAFFLDGKIQEKRSVDLRARGRATVELTRTFHEAGFHTLSFRLEGDDLPLDDERFLAFPVRRGIDVLLVDGAWAFDPFERPTGLIGLMLNPAAGGAGAGVPEGKTTPSTGGAAASPSGEGGGGEWENSLFNPVTVDYKAFNAGRENPASFDCVIFADVEGFSGDAAAALFDYVSSGGSAVFFMGDRVDLEAWNLRLYDDPARRLLPARLEKAVGDAGGRGRTAFFTLTAQSFDHPVMKVFDDPKLKVLLDVPVFRFIAVAAGGGRTAAGGGPAPAEAGGAEGEELARRLESQGVRVVAWFSDPLGKRYPAILEKSLGRGRVMLFTTSADSSWTMIPESPKTFLPLLHETVYYLTAEDPRLYNLPVGAAASRSVAEFPERVSLTGPGGEKRVIGEKVERREFGRYVLPLADYPLDRAGTYVLEVDSSLSGKRLRECYAANVDPLEGDLRRIDDSALDRLLPGAGAAVVESASPAEAKDSGRRGGEIWRPILWILAALVALELFLSWKFGRTG